MRGKIAKFNPFHNVDCWGEGAERGDISTVTEIHPHIYVHDWKQVHAPPMRSSDGSVSGPGLEDQPTHILKGAKQYF